MLSFAKFTGSWRRVIPAVWYERTHREAAINGFGLERKKIILMGKSMQMYVKLIREIDTRVFSLAGIDVCCTISWMV